MEGASPGVQPAHAHACSDMALGTGFKLLKMVSVGGGDCLGRVITHLGSLDCVLLAFMLLMASVHIRRPKKDIFVSEQE